MQETRNNCFGSKKRRTTLLQSKTSKHECRNVTATLVLHSGTRAYLFSPEEGSCYVFRPETIIASFFHSMVLLSKVLFNHICIYCFPKVQSDGCSDSNLHLCGFHPSTQICQNVYNPFAFELKYNSLCQSDWAL